MRIASLSGQSIDPILSTPLAWGNSIRATTRRAIGIPYQAGAPLRQALASTKQPCVRTGMSAARVERTRDAARNG